jgi:2-keto-4-pentenoate hydratase/2-oxohepta-3-ene-1,7-dioic acid hydratase in catechol pathway
MKLAQFTWKGSAHVGIVEGDTVHDSGEASVDQILTDGKLGVLRERWQEIVKGTEGIPLVSVRLHSPVRSPQKIFCMAENYRAHAAEAKGTVAKKPYLFTKFANTIVGPNDPIVIPRISQKVDWEAELAAVIGKEGKRIAREDALGHVAGYCVANDVSFRDLQFPEGWPEKLSRLGQNWVFGKGLDGAFPLGPWLTTADEVTDSQDLGISLKVNGELKQNSRTSDMVFGVAELIEHLSTGITLRPGDIISTGTPHGVAAFTDQKYLKEGDVVEATVEGIGTLRNQVVSE